MRKKRAINFFYIGVQLNYDIAEKAMELEIGRSSLWKQKPMVSQEETL